MRPAAGREQHYKVTDLGLKKDHKKKLVQRFRIEVSEEETRRLAVEALKSKRDQLRQAIELVKHTVKLQQAKKRLAITDLAIGRMVFFKEDMQTAVKKAKKSVMEVKK